MRADIRNINVFGRGGGIGLYRHVGKQFNVFKEMHLILNTKDSDHRSLADTCWEQLACSWLK